MPLVLFQSRRGVAPDDLLSVQFGHDGDVLTDGEAKGISRMRKAEFVPISSACRRADRLSIGDEAIDVE